VPKALVDRVSSSSETQSGSAYNPFITPTPPDSLLHRLGEAPQELNSNSFERTQRQHRADPDIIFSEFDDTSAIAQAHFTEHGHLQIREQIQAIFNEERIKRENLRRQRKRLPLIVPRRKPLPPPIPLAQPSLHLLPKKPDPPVIPLAVRLTKPPPLEPLPLSQRIDINFKKADDVTAIFDRQISATIKRVKVLFNKDNEKRFYSLPHDTRLSLEKLADQLDVLSERYREFHTLPFAEKLNIRSGLHLIGDISFTALGPRFSKITSQVASVYDANYFIANFPVV
jgi:hypothetical protein